MQELNVLIGFHTHLERSLCNQNNKDLKSLGDYRGSKYEFA
jgi:hypothetical protein